MKKSYSKPKLTNLGVNHHMSIGEQTDAIVEQFKEILSTVFNAFDVLIESRSSDKAKLDEQQNLIAEQAAKLNDIDSTVASQLTPLLEQGNALLQKALSATPTQPPIVPDAGV